MSPPPVDSSIRAALKLHSPQVVGIVNNYLKLLQIETRVRSYSADLRQAAAFANATRQTGEARQTDGRYKYAKFRRNPTWDIAQKVRNPGEIRIQDPDCDPYRAQKLISLSLA